MTLQNFLNFLASIEFLEYLINIGPKHIQKQPTQNTWDVVKYANIIWWALTLSPQALPNTIELKVQAS